MVTVVAVSGSLRAHSHTRLALRRALVAGADADLLDLRSVDLPPLNPDVDDWGDYAFVDETLESRVATLGQRIVESATIDPDPRTSESDQNVGG